MKIKKMDRVSLSRLQKIIDATSTIFSDVLQDYPLKGGTDIDPDSPQPSEEGVGTTIDVSGSKILELEDDVF